jgi:hypothetical protein
MQRSDLEWEQLKRVADALEQLAAVMEQERIAERQRSLRDKLEAHTQAKQAVRKVPVKLEQMTMLELEPA